MKKKPSKVTLRFSGKKKHDNTSDYVLEELNPLIIKYKEALKNIEGLRVGDYLWDRSLVLILNGSDDNIILGLEALFDGNLFPNIVYSSKKGYRLIRNVLDKYNKELMGDSWEKALRTITVGMYSSNRHIVDK